MKIHVRKGNLAEAATEAAVVTHFEGDAGLGGAAAKLDKKSGGLIGEIIAQGDFTGRLNRGLRDLSPGEPPGKAAGFRRPGEEGGFFSGAIAGGLFQGGTAYQNPERQRILHLP